MLPLIQNEITRRGWLQEEDFPDIVALSSAAPGILAVNISIFTGYRLRGVKGSIAATLGSVLPSFTIILAIAALFSNYQDNPVILRIFMGIRPVVVALIAVPMVNMAKKACGAWWAWAIMFAALGLTAFLKVSPVYILLVTAVLSASIAAWRGKKGRRDAK